jgi:hypothetical protein
VDRLHLPSHLPALAELEALNKRLQSGEICLDWRAVQIAPDSQQLETLFAGLDLSEHIDLIGAETIPQAIMPAILAAFAAVEKQTAEQA